MPLFNLNLKPSTTINADYLMSQPDFSRRILANLTREELNDCALVNKTWNYAVHDSIKTRNILLDVEVLRQLESKKQNPQDYLATNFKYATSLDIRGWSAKKYIPTETYNLLLKSNLRTRVLTLRGRGKWSSCLCPSEKSLHGEQIGSIERDEMTQLEYIHVKPTFEISACALLDLISRSPKLKVLKFQGILINHEHSTLFEAKHFASNIDVIFWPWPKRHHYSTLSILVKRNENISTFYSNSETTCDLLASDLLNNLKFLSLILNENWNCKPNKTKKIERYTEKVKYLCLAKNLEALEIRTFDLTKDNFEEDDDQKLKESHAKIDRYFEQYKLTLWEQVANLPKLKYLAVYGSWEFEEVCREMSRHELPVEFLKINLLPSSVINDNEAGEGKENDREVEKDYTLAISNGIRNLRKLISLRSLQYTCYEKLSAIDDKTTAAMKEIVDLFWSIDVKCPFTNEWIDFLTILGRRGNQLGKSYDVIIHVYPDSLASSFVINCNLRSLLPDIRYKLTTLCEKEVSMRYGSSACQFHIWGFEQVGNTRDKLLYDRSKFVWQFYNRKFTSSSTSF